MLYNFSPLLILVCYADKEPIITQYFISLYWAAATGASVGYGDIVAKTQLEVSALHVGQARMQLLLTIILKTID